MPNTTKDSVLITITLDLAGLVHLQKGYLRGVKTMILSIPEVQRSNEWRRMVEETILREGYMTEAEVKLMDGDTKVQRYLTEEDAKLGG